ncbi:MAG: FtsW/RodA/SpoVE family cell cycle protein [Firmicutes bacterium]|nr:FtsW/RodA/SpoVE family cell cycle protein [Bacillota bacterium]
MTIGGKTISGIFEAILNFSVSNPALACHITTVLRWVFVVLAVYILVRCIMSLLSTRATPEVWGYFYVQDGQSYPITHWENIIGRSNSADLSIPLKTISKTHAMLIRRPNGKWMFKDLNSKNGTVINGVQLIPSKRYLINAGDEIVMGGVHCTLAAMSVEETINIKHMRSLDKEPIAPWKILIAITVFQALAIVQLIIGMGSDMNFSSMLAIVLLCALMWGYVMLFKALGRKGFEMEMIAFFMSTINLVVTASSAPYSTLKQFIAIALGLCLMVFMCIVLRDIQRSKQIRPLLAGLSVLLLIINLVFGSLRYGASNWVEIGGITIQPSELVKLAFICIGAASLEELYNKKNIIVYALFSLFCLGCLAIMGDFGTALIFFVTYLVVSFLRSGDFSKLILTVVGAGIMGIMVLRFKPYIASRFATWGHVWEYADSTGYQQVRTMAFGAGGGLLGVGVGNGSLKYVGASNTDLVFGFVMEEWGFIIAVLLVLCLITLCLFAVNSIMAGRSTFFTIGACGAASMMLFQTMLNIFGAVDLFPLTGVTFPFVSVGGTSMIASWGMLAYFKAADMRKDASLAIRREVDNA